MSKIRGPARPAYIEAFTAETDISVNVILVTDMNDALIRAVVDGMPIDGIMVPFDMREEFSRAGRIIELHTVLHEFPNPNFQTAMRWMWSSVEDKPVCGFLIGEVADPTFACIWYKTERIREVAELIRYLVLSTLPSAKSVLSSRTILPVSSSLNKITPRSITTFSIPRGARP